MTNENRKVFNKENPSAEGRKFIPLSSNAKHYIHHDKIDACKLFLYALIVDYYNVNLGYAYPSQERLAVDYGKTSKTTGIHLKDLRDVGLIAIPASGKYVPLEPLSEEEFYRKYPKSWTNYKKAYEDHEKRREAGRKRLEKHRAQKRDTRN